MKRVGCRGQNTSLTTLVDIDSTPINLTQIAHMLIVVQPTATDEINFILKKIAFNQSAVSGPHHNINLIQLLPNT